LNEKIDIWSLGYNYYTLLTGLFPFYRTESYSAVKSKAQAGEKPWIDPRWLNRTLAERRLAEIIPLCWAFNPDDRIDIGTLVHLLRDAWQELQ
jgi:serine/threonine protein kinase